jgi:hypothetical protein
MELAVIPLIILSTVLAAAAFFTDIHQNTIITALSARRGRRSIAVSKLSAVLIAAAGAALVLTAAYTIIGILFYNAGAADPTAYLFNGTEPAVMTSVNYYTVYFLSLILKLSVFIITAGLFSLSKAEPLYAVGLTLLTAIMIILTNAIFGGFLFYQFIPILAIDPINYFGATLFLSPMPPEFNILYTMPLFFAIVAVAIWQLIYNFRKRDF